MQDYDLFLPRPATLLYCYFATVKICLVPQCTTARKPPTRLFFLSQNTWITLWILLCWLIVCFVLYLSNDKVGYREIPETAASLKRIFKNLTEASTDEGKCEATEKLQELITNVQFANDEGDPGMGLELGLDAFCYGGERLHSYISHLLGVGYELLNRQEFGRIAQAHLKKRNQGGCFQIQ